MTPNDTQTDVDPLRYCQAFFHPNGVFERRETGSDDAWIRSLTPVVVQR